MPKNRKSSPSQTESFERISRIVQRTNWDQLANTWDFQKSQNGLNIDRVDLIKHYVKSPVLLIGAGHGYVLRRLQESFENSIGVDWSVEMVARAQREEVINVVAADAESLPCEDESFETAIISTGVLLPTHGTERMRRYIAEARRVLRKSGTLITCLFYEKDNREGHNQVEFVQWPLDTISCFLFWDLSIIESIFKLFHITIKEIIIDDDVAILVGKKDEINLRETKSEAGERQVTADEY